MERGWFNVLKIAGFLPSPTETTYMVKNSIWEEAGTLNRLAGIEELEMGLGRELTLDDFTHAPVNWDWDWNASWKHTLDPVTLHSQKLKEKRIGEQGRKFLAEEWLRKTPMSKKIKLLDKYSKAMELVNQ